MENKNEIIIQKLSNVLVEEVENLKDTVDDLEERISELEIIY